VWSHCFLWCLFDKNSVFCQWFSLFSNKTIRRVCKSLGHLEKGYPQDVPFPSPLERALVVWNNAISVRVGNFAVQLFKAFEIKVKRDIWTCSKGGTRIKLDLCKAQQYFSDHPEILRIRWYLILASKESGNVSPRVCKSYFHILSTFATVSCTSVNPKFLCISLNYCHTEL
jgi:hypothetical protein